MFMILGWFESEQRQPEAVLASALAVAAAAIAAVLGKDRDDLTDEIDCRVVTEPINIQLDLNRGHWFSADWLLLRRKCDRHLP